MRAVLAPRGMGLTLYRVRKLMRELGIRGVVPSSKKRATVPGPGAPARPDLVRRDFEPPAPTTVLCGDIAYLRTGQGWLCLATAIGLCTRMVAGWSLSERMTADVAASALETAKARGCAAGNAIFHSDSRNAVSRLCGRATKPASCKPGPHRSALARTPIEGPNASAAWPAQRSAPCHAPDLSAARGGPDGGPRLPGPWPKKGRTPAVHPVTALSGSRFGEGAQRNLAAREPSMQRPEEGQAAIGVDARKETRVAAAVDRQGALVDERRFAAARQGCRQLESRARSLGGVLRAGVECSGSYGSGLAGHLAKNGLTVLEATSPDRTVRRKRGKDGFVDAETAAEAALSGVRTVAPKSRDGTAEALRMPQKARSTAVAARRAALQTTRARIASAPEEPRGRLRGMARMQLIGRLSATRPDPAGFKSPVGAARISPRRLAKRYVGLDDEVSGLDETIGAVLADAAPLLVECSCVGPQSAAQPMATVGDDPERLRSEAAFSMLCGVAPMPVSSGMACRRRLDRGGGRQASSAVRIMAVGRLRTDERAKDYVARKMAEGHAKMEAIRCLRRYIARETCYAIKKQRKLVNCS